MRGDRGISSASMGASANPGEERSGARCQPAREARARRERRGAANFATALVLALALVSLAACGSQAGEASQPPAEAAEETGRVINVEVEVVTPSPFTERVRVVGTVEAERDVVVSAEEGGVIRRLYAEKGAEVKAGQPIAKIDDRVLQAQLDQATSEAMLAEETWERQRQLWEEDRIGTEMSYLQARYRAQTARANARVLAERVDRTVVRAPIEGILDDRFVEIGTMVSPGSPVVRVMDMDTAVIRAGVPERYAVDIERGRPVSITVDALGGRVFEGLIDWVGAAVDPDGRTFGVEVLVPNPGATIKPGMVADVRIDRRDVEEAVVVPQEAVLRREDGYIVYVIAENAAGASVAETRSVQPGSSQGARVVIESGLEPGDRVVVVGQQQLAAGDRVRIVNEGGR